jgi:hypothetical protein
LITNGFNDYAPSHCHAWSGEFEAMIEIGALTVLDGNVRLPNLQFLIAPLPSGIGETRPWEERIAASGVG